MWEAANEGYVRPLLLWRLFFPLPGRLRSFLTRSPSRTMRISPQLKSVDVSRANVRTHVFRRLAFPPGFPTLSSLLAVTMIQTFSLPEKFRSVSRTAYGDEKQRVRKLNLQGPSARLLPKTVVGTPRPPLSQYKTCDQLQSVNRRSTTIAGAISKRLGPGSIGKTS